MSIKIIKFGDTITALQFDVIECIRNEENISKVIDKSETLLKEIEINTEVATSTDQENKKPKVIDFFDYKPPKDWYMTLFNTILDYCTSRNIINEKTINKGIEQLLKKFVKYSELIDYLDNAKKFIVLNSESIILDTENGNKWNTSSFEKNYRNTDDYLIDTDRIKSMSFPEIFANSKICGLFKIYNKSDFKPYNPLKEKAALDNDTYNYYKPVFTVAPQLDKDLEKKFRHGAVFLCKVLKNMAENNLTKYRWLLGYIAHMIQYPSTLVQQYIVINSSRDIGKNTIMQPLEDMFGEYGIIKQDMNGVTGRFNTDLDRKVFICLDETEDGKKSERIFKGLIGNKSIGVERKGKDRKQIKNFTHVFMMSNEIDSPFGLGERKGVGFFPEKPNLSFERYYRDCVLKSDAKNKDVDPVKYNQFLNYLWYQLSQIDFVALGYDPISYPKFARKAVLKAMQEHPQNLDQSVLGSCIEYHRILLESIKKLECGQEISSKLFDIKTLKNLKSSIGQLERYNNKETKKLSTYLNMIVCYCAQRAYDDGFTTTRVNPVINEGHLEYINSIGGKNEIIKSVKDKLGKLYREYNIYPKDGDMKYKIMHPADVLKNIGAID